MNRMDIGNGESLPLDLDSIQVGDWVQTDNPRIMGQVTKVGCWERWGEGFIVRISYPAWAGANGFIAKEDARILGLGPNPDSTT